MPSRNNHEPKRKASGHLAEDQSAEETEGTHGHSQNPPDIHSRLPDLAEQSSASHADEGAKPHQILSDAAARVRNLYPKSILKDNCHEIGRFVPGINDKCDKLGWEASRRETKYYAHLFNPETGGDHVGIWLSIKLKDSTASLSPHEFLVDLTHEQFNDSGRSDLLQYVFTSGENWRDYINHRYGLGFSKYSESESVLSPILPAKPPARQRRWWHFWRYFCRN